MESARCQPCTRCISERAAVRRCRPSPAPAPYSRNGAPPGGRTVRVLGGCPRVDTRQAHRVANRNPRYARRSAVSPRCEDWVKVSRIRVSDTHGTAGGLIGRRRHVGAGASAMNHVSEPTAHSLNQYRAPQPVRSPSNRFSTSAEGERHETLINRIPRYKIRRSARTHDQLLDVTDGVPRTRLGGGAARYDRETRAARRADHHSLAARTGVAGHAPADNCRGSARGGVLSVHR